MSCGCESSSGYAGGYGYNGLCNADTPYPSTSSESVPSLINNLVTALYGQIQKNVSNGQVVWTLPCDPTNPNTQITNLPQIAGEGMLCYIIRGLQYAINNAYPVTLNGVQTLTNKTLTAPIINNSVNNTPTINTPTINNATINTATGSNITITNASVLGTLSLPTGSITSGMIANGTIVPADLSTGAPSWDTSGNLTAVGNAKLTAASTTGTSIQLDNSGSAGGKAWYITSAGSANGSGAGALEFYTVGGGTINTQGNPITNCKTTAKAWVNFDGTGTYSPNPSTSKIRSSYNVSSITKNGTGDYTVNFATAMTDANYSTNCVAQYDTSGTAGNVAFLVVHNYMPTTTSVRVKAQENGNQNLYDVVGANVAIFGN